MTDTTASRNLAQETTFTVLFAIAFCHLLNDMMQAVIPAIYPTLKADFHLSFAQIGLITLAFQCTASLLQPAVGFFADIKPMPYSRSEEHTSELQSRFDLVCRLLLEKKKKKV